MTLPAFAAERRLQAHQLSTDARTQQQTRQPLLSIDETNRLTYGRTDSGALHRPCSAYYAGSTGKMKYANER